MAGRFSFNRFRALLAKEFIQAFRDRLTFAMMVGVPIIQLILFGYAINSDPHYLPAAVVSADNSEMARSIIAALQNSAYFKVAAQPSTEAEADRMITRNEVQFVIYIPQDFARDLVRGVRPVLLVEADATDPVATANAVAALSQLNQTALMHDLVGPLAPLAGKPEPFAIEVHNRYNPEGATEYNIVPGLIGTILTMTLVMMTAIAVTRERERGTMESLLATTARPLEVMLGKIAPFILIGYIQVVVIVGAAKLLFGVPMLGSLTLLSLSLVVFIAANLAVGFTFSTLAQSQMQAMQMGVFFFLPSMLLSGFLFPFRGMPEWAQVLGEALPLTHMLRIVRGILLKGSTLADIAPQIWPMLIFLAVVSVIALKRYRQTLD
jgi:ABC-2 type transport system permease protein